MLEGFPLFLSKWDSELWLTGYVLSENVVSIELAIGSVRRSLEEENTQTMHDSVEREIPADGECITLSYFIQVNAFFFMVLVKNAPIRDRQFEAHVS